MVYRTADQIEAERKRAIGWAKKTRDKYGLTDEWLCESLMCRPTNLETIERGSNSTLSPIYVAIVINRLDEIGYSITPPKYVINYVSLKESQSKIKWFRSEAYHIRSRRRKLRITMESVAAALGITTDELKRYEHGEYIAGSDSVLRRYKAYLERNEHHG